MESEYDQKFEDMKKYIPFLESMIKRLESTNALSANPRQAQLDKIKSLRDLLLDKKKRMKMENLLKCEQVLVNLYAKVEQKDTLPIRSSGPSGNDSFKMDNNLEIVRNKLKRVSKIQDEAGTLPEIVRASDIEDVCTAGSVEPALFQRRPHKKSPTLSDVSPSTQEKINSPETTSTRKYTRVLMSPERNSRVRSTSHDSIDGALFSRRSPRKSPKRSSSSHSKKDSKKSSSSKVSPGKTKDLNITLNVPEESLNSLNTKDIVSRIITCNDNDVDIDTLRGLRTQILSELKQTGANDDISDLILKSYTEKNTTSKKKEDIEEGELSDSESEAIENIYGSLVLVDKDKTKTEEKPFLEKNQPRKIQICLVINSKDKSEPSTKEIIVSDPKTNEETDLEMFNKTKENIRPESKIDQNQKLVKQASNTSELEKPPDSNDAVVDDTDSFDTQKSSQEKIVETTEDHIAGENLNTSDKVTDEKVITINKEIINAEEPSLSKNNDKNSLVTFKANFYKPLQEEESSAVSKNTYLEKRDKCSDIEKQDLSSIFDKKDGSVEIPLLNEPVIHENPVEKDIDSQIDILQALKNEILADNILPVPNLDVITPPLHQPKLSKVAGVQSISTKKRISIEKYKEKTAPATLTSGLSNDVISSPLREDNNKKQSLKLTEKECERFNFPAKLNIHDDMSSEDETHKDLNFAPKSPDDDTRFVAKTQPVIIPVDPVKTPVINIKADVDMRTMATLPPKISPVISNTTTFDKTEGFKNDAKNENSGDFADKISTLLDPRTRKDISQPLNWDSKNLAVINFDAFSKSTPSSNKVFNTKLTPSMTPNAMSFDLTGNHHKPDIELKEPHKPAFVHSFPFESKDSSTSDEFCSPRNSEKEAGLRKSRWGDHDQDFRNNTNSQRSKYGDPYKRDADIEKKSRIPADNKNDEPVPTHGPLTPLPLFGWAETSSAINQFGRLDAPIATLMNLGRQDCSNTSTHPFGNSDGPPTLSQTFNRSDMPLTPSHPFGRTDCPMTPNHPFGRTDCPSTPIHPFGRSDCPPTPSHSFGRGECPATPIHPFGRSDCPATPSHPFGRSDIAPTSNPIFGRSDCPATPSHPFGRIDAPPMPNNPFMRIDFPGPIHQYGMPDCPATPIHPFSRFDCPQTPSHAFGMSECPNTPSHPFGRVETAVTSNYSFNRTDHSQSIPLNKQFSKDPRLNRRSEYEARRRRDERNHENYNDREFNAGGFYRKQSQGYGKSESYVNHDRKINDNRRSTSISYSERSMGHEMPRDYDKEKSGNTERGKIYKYHSRSKRRDRESDERYYRGRSSERSNDSYENTRSQCRDDSLTRNKKVICNENKLSVKGDAGRSFTIDTSVNSTFQDLLKKKGLEIRDTSLDARKDRAGSVGRSRVKSFVDSSDESTIAGDSNNRNKNYKRASSVGRDLYCEKDSRSYQEVKTDFQCYKSNLRITEKVDGNLCDSKEITFEEIQKNKGFKEDVNTNPVANKQTYSPRKNYRDPRMRRDYDEKNKYGFSYSSDSIAKGTILGSGYGVKNYKIPKIKRPHSDIPSKDTVNDEVSECDDTKLENCESKTFKDTHKKEISDESKDMSSEIPSKRITRSAKKQDEVKSPTSSKDGRMKTRRKKFVYNSSSDEDIVNKESVDNNVSTDDEKATSKYCESNKNEKNKKETKPQPGTNDIEIFSDNFPDHVTDNINALIDNLDNHIDNSRRDSVKNTEENESSNTDMNATASLLIKEDKLDVLKNDSYISVDKQSKHSDIQEKDHIKEKIDSLTAISFEPNLEKSHEKSAKVSDEEKYLDRNKKDDVDVKTPVINAEISSRETIIPTSASGKDTNNESIVSTTGSGNIHEEMAGSAVESVEGNIATSPADSTNEITQAKPNEHTVPDSTNEIHEMNSDVSSSLTTSDVSKDFVESGSSRLETIAPLNSIGSLLSMLQDKSKIHQLLSMLGDQTGDNDKIKRKLEKLSEIVSDDEEELAYNKDNTDHNITNTDTTSKLSKNNGDVEVGEEKVVNTEVTESVQTKNVEDNNIKEEKEQNIEKEDTETISNEAIEINAPKKGKGLKKGKGKNSKAGKAPRVTRAAVAHTENPPTVKKLSRELIKLREDIKEMFLTDEMLNSTGIRMCRLAKLVDEKSVNRKDDITQPNPKPVVVLEKYKNHNKSETTAEAEKTIKKKPSPKSKRNVSGNSETSEDTKTVNFKPKPVTKNISMSKTKVNVASKQQEVDPYEFETDSVDTNAQKDSESEEDSDTETNSLASSHSFGSSELLADLQKKTKRKRRGKAWQAGIIEPKNKKKKQTKKAEPILPDDPLNTERNIVIPDKDCFTDKYYCFQKNVSSYSCRLCVYTGDDIILHYKQQHPHTEIPLSRMNPETAKEAIEQCQEVNFPAISKISTHRYVCRFCFKEFSKAKTLLESFFWHIVSMHTGEYKQTCSECDPQPCFFYLDIPSPPKDNKGQLIGYLCGKCNFTQVSLENLKTHVIGRHNDEQTDVYTINLSAMSRKTLKSLAIRNETPAPRVLRSSLSNRSASDNVDDNSEISEKATVNESMPLKEEPDLASDKEKEEITSIQSKIAFESDGNIKVPTMTRNDSDNSIDIKQESFATEIDEPSNIEDRGEPTVPDTSEMELESNIEETQQGMPDDILDCPHFKICYKESGIKEYVCCINGKDNHYKTSLLISMKKHVQSKHEENWDGYCTMCKVIVKPPGTHSFKDCLQHFIDRHMDEFPVLETVTEVFNEDPPVNVSCDVSVEPKYINVRPLDQLIFSADQDKSANDNSMTVPVIESVVSLNSSVALPQPSPNYTSTLGNEHQEIKQYKYEEWQGEVMSKKHRVVLNAMMTQEKLIKIYKCTGRFCSFTTDNAEHALLHATTHQRIGGEGAMNCAYCDFDACNNGIDLVMHVFKAHGNCQYACGLCFYRALASQLVRSHMNRKHPNNQSSESVLNTATDTKPVTDDSDNILSREVAVPHYMCEQSSPEVDGGPCKFRTYTPTQFCEHLQQRHRAPYPCNMCPNVMSNASEMVNHMKEHGYRLYQCTCCVFGADNENDMLDHASICHPMRLPQAYLRVITNTGGQQLKVLPRVYLNKCKVATKHVASDVSDDPVREAERCIELEKLIGNTETVNQVNVASSSRVHLDTISDSGVVLQDEPFIDSSEQELVDPNYIPDMVTNETDKKSVEQTENRVFKTEPNETPSTKPHEVVYCLDSDEEDPMQRVIDLSDEDLIATPTVETTTTEKNVVYKKIPSSSLFLCPVCKNVYRNCRTLKKHFYTCFPTMPVGELKCPHEDCTKTIIGSNGLLHHYNRDHTYTTIYVCGVCNSEFKAAASVKQHMKVLHKLSQFAPNPVSTVVDGNTTVVIHPAESARRALPTRKRYGPQDIDQLPINPILDSLVYCSLCEFNTKVRLNMVRHLQLHAQQQPAPQTAPVNPVPHLETNEKHFDKMLNLASSSIANRPPPEKQIRPENSALVALVPAENASRYPKFVADRQRFTCGAKGCAYISVDEAMFRCHWDTLHANMNDYHCVHCPPYQHLDTSRPLTSGRIISHLKMHDGNLFACSVCSFYHYKRTAVEKHSSNAHTDAQVLIVRQEGLSATVSVSLAPVTAPPSSAPTMDLKPWQCGLCKFKSMLRPEVAEHCSKVHQSKMQYKCNYCPFRTSTIENVTKHQSKSHPDKSESVFYYYYREGSIPDEDGTPKWVKQSQKVESSEPVVKSEVPEPSTSGIVPAPVIPVPVTPAPVAVDLKLVKQEVEEPAVIPEVELSPEDLCKKFGDFCEPVGLNYKCPLCNGVVEEAAEAMRSHLFEELKYRKWGCTLCSYKAFHKEGLNAHITSEHRRKNVDHIELETNFNIEKWVTQLLEYQTSVIEKNKISPIIEEIPSTSKEVADKSDSELYMEQVELAFGPFGSPRDGMFCCPKCEITIEDERAMKEHLESELAKIRWGCSNCSFKSAVYHETRFHCKIAHPNISAKPLEAVRQPRLRACWVHLVIYKQKQMIKSLNPQLASPEKNTFSPDPQENSLLVVRYEERVPTPETTVRRKRSASDSNEEKLVIDESKSTKKKSKDRQCSYCGFKTKWPSTMREHTLRHFNLKPFTCAYCDLQGHRYVIAAHITKQHPGKLFKMELTPVPIGPPVHTILPRNMGRKPTEILPPQICLYCEKSMPESEIPYHIHKNFIPEFAKKGEVVVKCGICSLLRLDVASLQEHHNESHADVPLNYSFVKLQCDLGDNYICGHCSSNFSDIKTYKAHHSLMHSTLHMKFVTALPTPVREELKRKHEDSTSEQSPKRVAKKSTTKLPFGSAVAKKSTTKLPFGVSGEVEDEMEYSVYGTKSAPLTEYANISTLVNFHNTMVPFTVKKLRTILNIEPMVQVKDIRK